MVVSTVSVGGPSEILLRIFRLEVLIKTIYLDNALGKRTRGAVALAGTLYVFFSPTFS